MTNERTIDTHRNGRMELLESKLTDGSKVYAIRAKDREDFWATFDCISKRHATDLWNAFAECTT